MYQKLIAKINSALQAITTYSARLLVIGLQVFHFEKGLLKYLNNYSRID